MIIKKFLEALGIKISKSFSYFDSAEEIRIRINKPIIIKISGDEFFLNKNGCPVYDIEKAYIVTLAGLKNVTDIISGYSLFSYEEELKNGFITTRGGNRIGISGKVVIENGKIKTIRDISSLNIRIAHEIKGCAERIINYLFDGNLFLNTLIISPPGCGKTTLLRDIIRLVSNRKGQAVSILDERNEIAATKERIPQNDVGLRSDILDLCPKSLGILQALRSLSPTLIAVDEIGFASDFSAIEYVINSGVSVLSTIHAKNITELSDKNEFKDFARKKYFKRYIVLTNKIYTGETEGIYDENFKNIYEVK